MNSNNRFVVFFFICFLLLVSLLIPGCDVILLTKLAGEMNKNYDVSFSEDQLSELRTAKSAGIKIIQVYDSQSEFPSPYNKENYSILPIYEVTKDVFNNVGIDVTENNVAANSIEIQVEANGHWITSKYEDIFTKAKKTQYSGARIEGSIKIIFKGLPPVELNFESEKSPPASVDGYYNNPVSAPYQTAFQSQQEYSFSNIIITLIDSIYGTAGLYNIYKNSKYDFLQTTALERIAGYSDSNSTQALITAIEDNSEIVRKTAWVNLLKRSNEKIIDRTIELLKSDSYESRYRSAEYLSIYKSEKAFLPLIEALRNDSSGQGCQAFAAKALGNYNDSSSVQYLINSLKSDFLFLRAYSAESLGRIKDFRAIEPLIPLLDDKEKTVRDAAENALYEITDESFGSRSSWEDWWKANKSNYIN